MAHADHILQVLSDLTGKREQPEMWMFECYWVLDAHIKEVVRRRSEPASNDEPDWDDEDEYETNELAKQVKWR